MWLQSDFSLWLQPVTSACDFSLCYHCEKAKSISASVSHSLILPCSCLSGSAFLQRFKKSHWRHRVDLCLATEIRSHKIEIESVLIKGSVLLWGFSFAGIQFKDGNVCLSCLDEGWRQIWKWTLEDLVSEEVSSSDRIVALQIYIEEFGLGGFMLE